MMMKRRTILRGSAAALLAGALPLRARAQSTSLRMSWWGGDGRHAATQAAIDAFKEANPGIAVEPEFTGWQGHLERITTQIAGGTEADLLQVNWNWLTLFSKKGDGFTDLNELSDTIDLTQWAPAMLQTGTVKGMLNGLPVSSAGRVFYFNSAAYEKAGIAIPTSWDDLIAAADPFRAANGADSYPFEAGRYTGWMLTTLYVTQKTGKSFIDPETDEIAWSHDELIDGFTFYKSLVDAHVIPDGATDRAEGNVELHEKRAWIDGRIGGTYDWNSVYWKLRDPLGASQDLVVGKTLRAPEAVTEGLFLKPTMLFAISKNSSQKAEAAKLLNFVLNEPDGVLRMSTERGIPASRAAMALLSESGLIDAKLAEAQAIVDNGEGPKVSAYFEHPQIYSMYQDTVEAFAAGKLTPEEAAETVIDEATRVLMRAT